MDKMLPMDQDCFERDVLLGPSMLSLNMDRPIFSVIEGRDE